MTVKRRFVRIAAGILLLAAFSGFIFSLAHWSLHSAYFPWSINWEEPRPLFQQDSSIYKVNGKMVVNLEERNISYIPYDEIPQDLIDAFIAVEDWRFYRHRGIDLRGVTRALVVNIRYQEAAQGGSTITQQLARNIFLDHDKTMVRKLLEMSIALELEKRYTKKEILEMYLNQIYFGSGNWGISQASRAYFQKPVARISLGEASILAGLVQAPSLYAPVSSWDHAIFRQQIVLQRMVELDYISSREAEEAVFSNVEMEEEVKVIE